MSLPDAGYAQTASGIIIPAATLDRLHRTVPEADFVKLKRNLAFAKAHGMRALYICDTCQSPIRMEHHDQIISADDTKDRKQPGGGRLSLECGCTTWMVR